MLQSNGNVNGKHGTAAAADRDEEYSALTKQHSSFNPDEEHDDGFGGGGSAGYRDDPHGGGDEGDEDDDDAEYGVSVSRHSGSGNSVNKSSSRWLTLRSAAGMMLLGALAGVALDRYHKSGGEGGVGVAPPHGVSVPPGGGHPKSGVTSEEDDGSSDDDSADDDAPSFDEPEDLHPTAGANRTKSEPPLPPLSSLVKGSKITGDVSWLLDFAVVDFPKCGTTFLMNYLGKADETYINHGEVCSMDRHRPYKIVNRYYPFKKDKRYTDDGRKIKYGLKCPEELETEYALDDYVRYFPEIKFIVTVRHPVLWFQSYYNFRAYNSFPLKMPPTDELIGPCMKGYPYVPWNCSHHCPPTPNGPSGNMKVCTDRAKFHHALSRLGKTPMNTEEEKALLNHGMHTLKTKNKVFLMENRQIILENPASAHFPEDLRDFLELETDLAPLKHFEKAPNRYSNEDALKERIDICEPQHAEARKVLVEHGRDAAKWITEYFIESDDVVVTSRERFVELLQDWGRDPCDDKERFMLR